ncbi:hypothetical protein [Shewanella livingstonensis]|uniref:Uncharacterized protein n=1 Tax=Shewanella livingstonensis TaxID=150120 RepID=A0A3G8LYS6_9GAMM|nr:hypothetical protein [Shewanella livingstonensis]AZG74836.1 hypothetical protein EGC82_20035 [Shewanella livingstonensis]
MVSTTYYVGSFEREVTLSSTVDKTYIGDHTIKMKAHVGSLGNQSPFQHVLRDHLGSVDTLTLNNMATHSNWLNIERSTTLYLPFPNGN